MKTSYENIKQSTLETINDFVTKGMEPGGFVTAVLENNLTEAFGRADDENRLSLFEIVQYVYNELPDACHGSAERVARWINCGGLEGLTKTEEVRP